jgi:putative transposase
MVTAGTLHKQHFYRGTERLTALQSLLCDTLTRRGWELRAWVVFSNHYHFIARAPEQDGPVSRLIQNLNQQASAILNAMDGTPGRQVWHQYWDKCLTFEKSYYPRLNYVLNNAVHHGLVATASQYPFCSAGWFENAYPAGFRKKVASFRFDRLQEPDDFAPEKD